MFHTDPTGESGPDAFDQIAGGDALRLALQQGEKPDEIIAAWQPGLAAFREERRPFLLYGEKSSPPPLPAATASQSQNNSSSPSAPIPPSSVQAPPD